MKRRKISLFRITTLTLTALLVLIIAVIIQSVYRIEQAKALAADLKEVEALSESDYAAAKDRYVALLPKKWEVEENSPLLNIDFIAVFACLPGQAPVSNDERGGDEGGGGCAGSGASGPCPPNCNPLLQNVDPPYGAQAVMDEMMACTGLWPNEAGFIDSPYPNEAVPNSSFRYNDYWRSGWNSGGSSRPIETRSLTAERDVRNIQWVQVNSPAIYYQYGGRTRTAYGSYSNNTISLPRPFINDKEVMGHEIIHYLEDRNGFRQGPPVGRTESYSEYVSRTHNSANFGPGGCRPTYYSGN